MTKDYSEIGGVLRHARVDLGVSLQTASKHLHIRAHYLQALENGELAILPSPAYVKGYLQSYATFLNLDKDEIIRRFEQVKNKIPERGYFFPQVFSTEKKPTDKVVWGGVGAALALYIIWVLLTKPATLPEFVVTHPLEETPTASIGFNADCAVKSENLYPPCYQKNNQLKEHKLQNVMELKE